MNSTRPPITPHTPSRSATKRVKDPLPMPTECNICQSNDIEVCSNSRIYHGKEYGKWPWVVMCKSCYSYVGLHPFTGIPLGTLADSTTRDARKAVKSEFIKWMTISDIKRNDAYQILADELDIPKRECHVAWFDTARCQQASKVLNKLIDKIITSL